MADKKEDRQQDLPEDMDFETALERLEAIVEELEAGELGLEEGLKKFELAMRLKEFCSRKLREAEARIEEYAAQAEAAGHQLPQTLFGVSEDNEEKKPEEDVLGDF